MGSADKCEFCMHYAYDEEYDSYYCEQSMELDEDDMSQFLSRSFVSCPFYQPGDSGYFLSGRQ